MAAFGLHGGHTIQRNCRFLVNNVKLFLGKRSFCRSAALQQQTEPEHQETSETIFIPRKKTWSKEAVLEALASTVGRDFTALPHKFQDDLYLSPRTFTESVIFSLSLNSGSAAAKYFINSNPMFFTKDFSEPHIPCLMPENVSLRLEEVSEEALKERIHLRKVQAAVDLYDQLLQAGTAVSMETTHDLLDLICLYCDRDPVQEGQPKLEYLSMERGKESQKSRWDTLLSKKPLNSSWTKNKNSERIFNLLPERDTRSYSALIRGMVMHNAPAKAFSFYTDMLNHRLKPDIHIFNALISAAPHVNPTSQEKSEAIIKLLKEMNQQNIQPNLQTFNNVLRSLKHCPPYNRLLSLKTMAEMKALGIAPSLASYSHILSIFTKEVSGEPSITDFLEEIMSELAGKSFTCQDPDDVYFFMNAMKLCCAQKDLELAYKVQSLVEFGENWRLLGHHYMQNVYYGFFFRLQCMMEHIDVVLTWFRQHYPSLYYPTHAEIVYLLRALETEGRLDLLPSIWKASTISSSPLPLPSSSSSPPESSYRPLSYAVWLHSRLPLLCSHWSPSDYTVYTRCSLPVCSYHHFNRSPYVPASSGRKYSLQPFPSFLQSQSPSVLLRSSPGYQNFPSPPHHLFPAPTCPLKSAPMTTLTSRYLLPEVRAQGHHHRGAALPDDPRETQSGGSEVFWRVCFGCEEDDRSKCTRSGFPVEQLRSVKLHLAVATSQHDPTGLGHAAALQIQKQSSSVAPNLSNIQQVLTQHVTSGSR
ncbi:small ribosomal subunit protein mS39 isoform X2 [Antennarius striatus]|uniref:small ribosomal subunit protein mS39 isoform X2 n=1 Tax=Antennarius striatus TaxID=241820 RepID=UPI0035B19F37